MNYAEMHEKRRHLIKIMCEYGDLIPRGEDVFEDMGGHIVHERNLDSYIMEFLKRLPKDELQDILRSLGGDVWD